MPANIIQTRDRFEPLSGRNGSGVCTYVRTNLNYGIHNILNNDNLECLFVEISKPQSTPFLVRT